MILRSVSVSVLAVLGAATIAPAQQSSERSALRSDTTRYVILNHGRPKGEMEVATAGDSVNVRLRFDDRSRQSRHVSTYLLDERGWVRRLVRSGSGVVAGVGATTERFAIESGTARWSSPGDSGQAPARDAAYVPRRPISYDVALLARTLLRRPDRRIALLPAGTARLEIAADTTLQVGGARRRLRLAFVDGLPEMGHYFAGPVWLDADDALVASQASALFAMVRRGDEVVLPTLRRIELAVAARRANALARRLAPRVTGAVVVRNGNVFDSERGVVRPRTTVVVQGDRIVAVGPADSIGTPRGATVIDATGKAVLPGMWDMHVHVMDPLRQGPASGLMWLAAGITTARDLGSDIDAAVLLRDGARAGTMLAPRMILAGLVDGPSPIMFPTEAVVGTPQEALAWVARYDSLGYRQVKLYNSVLPELVPIIAAEAHRRGIRVSGHVPRGMTLQEAIRDGFDEVNHGRYVISTFFPDSARWSRAPHDEAFARYDVSSRELAELMALLKERGFAIDATANLHEDRSQLLPDGTDPVFGPTFAWLPPLLRRDIQSVPAASAGAAAQAQAVAANMRRLIKRLFDAGVTIVPGTDYVPGLSYHGELEVYQRAGIPAASVLQIATIVPTRVMGEEQEYGSIETGKVADLVIVDGRPEQDVRHLRRTEWVLRAGRPYRVADLYRAAGLTPTETPATVQP